MEWVETTGRSVQEAKETALDELGVDEVDAEFEVLAEAQTGLFGRLRSEARVRARVRPTAPRPKEDRRDRRRRNNKSAGGAGSDDSDGTAGTPPAGSGAGGNGRKPARAPKRPSASAPPTPTPASTGTDTGTATRPVAGTENGSPSDTTEPGDRPDGEGGANRAPRRRGGRGRSRAGTSAEADGSQDAGSASRSGGEDNLEDGDDLSTKGTGVEVDLDQQAEVAVDFLKGLTREFGLQATVQIAKPDEDTVELQLTGSDLGILIGPKGATLVALQNLTRTVVFNETGGNNGHIDVDVAGYRQKRNEALARFATQVAGTVKESGERTALEPMSSIDRKIVHDTISGIDGVSTASEGEEPHRRVVVLPG